MLLKTNSGQTTKTSCNIKNVARKIFVVVSKTTTWNDQFWGFLWESQRLTKKFSFSPLNWAPFIPLSFLRFRHTVVTLNCLNNREFTFHDDVLVAVVVAKAPFCLDFLVPLDWRQRKRKPLIGILYSDSTCWWKGQYIFSPQTANLLFWMLYNLGRLPQIQGKLIKEIDKAVRNEILAP